MCLLYQITTTTTTTILSYYHIISITTRVIEYMMLH